MDKKFKDLTVEELLMVLQKYIDDNKYGSNPEYISFENWFKQHQFSVEPRIKDIVEYFEMSYDYIDNLKEFYKRWFKS